MITFFTCVPSKAALEETKVIYLCRTMWKSCTLSTPITLVLPVAAILFLEQVWFAGGKDTKEGRQTVFVTAVDPMNEPQEGEPFDVTKPRQVPCRTRWKVYQNALCWINLKSHYSVTERLLYQKTRLSLRLPPKVLLMNAWQVQMFNTMIIINLDLVQGNLL